MTVGLLDSAIYGALLSDDETARLFSDAAELRCLLDVEAALARAQGRTGVIPGEAAARIDMAARSLTLDPRALAAGTQTSGVPIIPLVAALRKAVGGEAAQYVHWGATSQDIVDTALILRLRTILEVMKARLDSLIAALVIQAESHRRTVMTARTRYQHAIPTTFGLKVAGWFAPLVRDRARLDELRPRLLCIQFGGAAGTLAALGDRGLAVMDAFAQELGLAAPVLPWHTQRDVMAEIANWLSLVSGSLGKMGQDVVLLAQSEVSEVRPGIGGGSSTMPQKSNPIVAETLVALARSNAGLLGNMHQAMIQENERGGSGWSLEWITLPQMAVASGAALRNAQILIENLEVDTERMIENLQASNGLVMAEAAVFALSRHIPRPEAESLVGAACREAADSGQHLADVLKKTVDVPIDWAALKQPETYLGQSDQFIDRAVAEARRLRE